MRILVTGALGHIGSRLIRDMADRFRDPEIVMVDNLATQRFASLFDLPNGAEYEFLELDVVKDDLSTVVEACDAVVHLAALTDAPASFQRAAEVETVNLRGTERIGRWCAGTGVPLVFLSTTSVYGPQAAVVDEGCAASEIRPQSPYADSKLRAERMLEELGRSDGLRFVTFRFGTIFGTSVGMRFHTAVNKFCWLAATGRPLTVWKGALDQKRPYLDLSDATQAICFAVSRKVADGRLFNVVTTNATVREVLGFIKEVVPDLSMEMIDSPVLNQQGYEVLSERIRREGFVFTGDLKRGVGETLALLAGIYPRSVRSTEAR